MRTQPLVLALTLAFAGGTALAADDLPPPPPPGGPGAGPVMNVRFFGSPEEHAKRLIERADSNHDQLISRDEAKAGAPILAVQFDAIDTNKDGQLSADELKAFHEAMRKAAEAEHKAHLAAMIKKLDLNGDGAVSRAEAQQGAPHLAKRFDKLDANKDGQLTAAELEAGMMRVHHIVHKE